MGMEAEGTSLGTSLLVPSVQELVKEPFFGVPPRYARPDQDPLIISRTSSLLEVPVIDLQGLFSEDTAASELEKLHRACKDWGFYQLINHGVSSALLERVKLGTQEIFEWPLEEKKKFWQRPGDMEGFGQGFVVSDNQKLDWGDLLFFITLPLSKRKPHLLPKLPPAFRDAMHEYSGELKVLAMKLLSQMAKALKMNAEDVMVLFDEGMQSMRMNYYPPCPQPELVTGISPHSDATGLTILLHVNEVEGLQIKKDGRWVPVKPIPGAFVVNIGDYVEILSNGAYPSIEHRATVNLEKERISIATFYNPKLDGDLGPAPSLISPENPPRFKRTTAADYFKIYFSRRLQGKSCLSEVRIQES